MLLAAISAPFQTVPHGTRARALPLTRTVPHSHARKHALQAEQARRVAAIEKKQQELQELVNQHSMVKELLEVNPPRSEGDQDMALQVRLLRHVLRSGTRVAPHLV